ncbi:MAG TPA: DUF2934 domain-containing protein [Vicinamibacteria bacterium]|nr:DUF2934 domain-containing protein [Vicinamibacteria bacterium]
MPKKVTKKPESNVSPKPTRRTRAKRGVIARGAIAAHLTDDQIRQRAYKIFREGRNPSDPTADWFQAEHELRAELGTR